jgi:hypothetical protein
MYSIADSNAIPAKTLRKNEFVMVIDSLGDFYSVVRKGDPSIRYMKKREVYNKSDVALLKKQTLEKNITKSSIPNQPPDKSYRVNGAGIVLAVVSAGLAWDYATEAGDLDDLIKDSENVPKSVKDTRDRKKILAILFGVGAAAGVLLSVETVDVQPSPDGLAFNYTIRF